MTTLTVASYNVWKNASLGDFAQDLNKLGRTNADVVGLQECRGRARARALDALEGWGVYQPFEPNRAEYDPIIWRESRFTLVSTGSRRVAKGALIRRNRVPVRYANWVELRDRITGRHVFVISTHVHAKIETKGRPRWWQPRRTRQAFRHIAALGHLARYLGHGGEVFITGDFNIAWDRDKRVRHPKFPYRALYKARDLVPCWAWSRARGGTHGNGHRKIDYVWHRRSEGLSPVKARILRDGYHSDHKPVLATYNIKE